MKVEMSGGKYLEGIRNFLKVYYKEELKCGSLKKAIKIYVSCFAIMIGLCLLMPGLKELYLVIIGFLLFMVLLISSVILLSLFISKRKKINNNIVRVEQIYEDKIYINAYLENGSVEKSQYNYFDVKKVVEEKEFFYIFIEDNIAFPLEKKDREKFVEMILLKGIVVKGVKKYEI